MVVNLASIPIPVGNLCKIFDFVNLNGILLTDKLTTDQLS